MENNINTVIVNLKEIKKKVSESGFYKFIYITISIIGLQPLTGLYLAFIINKTLPMGI